MYDAFLVLLGNYGQLSAESGYSVLYPYSLPKSDDTRRIGSLRRSVFCFFLFLAQTTIR